MYLHDPKSFEEYSNPEKISSFLLVMQTVSCVTMLMTSYTLDFWTANHQNPLMCFFRLQKTTQPLNVFSIIKHHCFFPT